MVKMKLKDLPSWLKGVILGGVIGLLFIIIALIIDAPKINRLPEFLILMLIIYVLFPALLGAIIGFFSARIKNKFVFWGGIIGLIVGLFSIPLFETRIGILFLYPLAILLKLILYISRETNVGEGGGIIAILFHIPLWTLIGALIGWIVGKVRKK